MSTPSPPAKQSKLLFHKNNIHNSCPFCTITSDLWHLHNLLCFLAKDYKCSGCEQNLYVDSYLKHVKRIHCSGSNKTHTCMVCKYDPESCADGLSHAVQVFYSALVSDHMFITDWIVSVSIAYLNAYLLIVLCSHWSVVLETKVSSTASDVEKGFFPKNT